MSETTDIMAQRIFLEVCMGIEKLCAELYHFYSDLYGDDPEASRLWKKTALEEENHQRQFGLVLRLLSDIEFELSKDNLDRAYSIQHKLLRLIEHVKHNKPELLTAVTKAVEMEENLSDLHVHIALKFKDESLRQMFTALNEADCEHVADLKRFRTILYLPQCEMEG